MKIIILQIIKLIILSRLLKEKKILKYLSKI